LNISAHFTYFTNAISWIHFYNGECESKVFILDEEGDKIHVGTDMELLEATQPSTKEIVLLIRLTVESRQKSSDPSIPSIPNYRNETEQNHTNKQFDEK
jgi:hypothetical protein